MTATPAKLIDDVRQHLFMINRINGALVAQLADALPKIHALAEIYQEQQATDDVLRAAAAAPLSTERRCAVCTGKASKLHRSGPYDVEWCRRCCSQHEQVTTCPSVVGSDVFVAGDE